MGKLTVKTGSTSRLEHVFILDSTSTTGTGKTGLTNASVTMHFFRPADTTVTSVTLSAGTLGTWTTGGFKEVNATDMPGLYEIGMPNAVFAATFDHSVVMIKGTGIAPLVLEYNLVAYDPLDTVRLGLTAIPNVVQGTTGAISTGNATGQVTVATNNDKTGYSLSGTQTFNVTGNITGNLSGSVGSVTGAVGSVTGAVGSVTGAVGSVTGNVGGNVTGSVGTLTATAVQNIWDDATTNNTVVGSVGKLIVDNLNATVSSRSTLTAANVWDALETSITTASSIGLKLKTNLDAAISTRMATFTYTAPPTAATISTQVWTEPIPGTFAVGSAGAKLNSASSAGDPWSTAVPGSYAAGTAGFILGTNLNATISSRMATFTYTAPPTVAQIWQTDVSAFSTVGQAGTYLKNAMPTFTYTAPPTVAQIWSTDISSYGSPTAGYGVWQGLIEASAAKAFAEQMTFPAYQQSMADYLLGRNIAGGSDGGRTVKDALRVLRNKTSITASTLTVYQEDDGATLPAAWTATLSTSATADPITGIDPV